MIKEVRLIRYIENLIGKPFEYGKNDCPLFIAGAIDAMHDTQLFDKYKGKWHDKKSAWKFIKKHGNIADHLKELGCSVVEFPFIQTGDIIIMEQKLAHEKKWHSAAIYTGSMVAIVTDENGVELVRLNKIPNACEVLRWQ